MPSCTAGLKYALGRLYSKSSTDYSWQKFQCALVFGEYKGFVR